MAGHDEEAMTDAVDRRMLAGNCSDPGADCQVSWPGCLHDAGIALLLVAFAQAKKQGDAVRQVATAEAHEWISAGHAALVLRLVINSPCNDLCR
jgi:hypothetical protein